jgi:hypothetical protein
MRKALQVLAAFFFFFLTLFGAGLVARSLEIISRPFDLHLPTWQVYYLDIYRGSLEFYAGCVMVSAALTFFWFQRRK